MKGRYDLWLMSERMRWPLESRVRGAGELRVQERNSSALGGGQQWGSAPKVVHKEPSERVAVIGDVAVVDLEGGREGGRPC